MSRTLMKRIDKELIEAIEMHKKLLEESINKKVTFTQASKFCAMLLKRTSNIVLWLPKKKRRKKDKINIFPFFDF